MADTGTACVDNAKALSDPPSISFFEWKIFSLSKDAVFAKAARIASDRRGGQFSSRIGLKFFEKGGNTSFDLIQEIQP